MSPEYAEYAEYVIIFCSRTFGKVLDAIFSDGVRRILFLSGMGIAARELSQNENSLFRVSERRTMFIWPDVRRVLFWDRR